MAHFLNIKAFYITKYKQKQPTLYIIIETSIVELKKKKKKIRIGTEQLIIRWYTLMSVVKIIFRNIIRIDLIFQSNITRVQEITIKNRQYEKNHKAKIIST